MWVQFCLRPKRKPRTENFCRNLPKMFRQHGFFIYICIYMFIFIYNYIHTHKKLYIYSPPFRGCRSKSFVTRLRAYNVPPYPYNLMEFALLRTIDKDIGPPCEGALCIENRLIRWIVIQSKKYDLFAFTWPTFATPFLWSFSPIDCKVSARAKASAINY